jgi:hypothetical protein
MEIIIYHQEYNSSETLENFIDLLNSCSMKYFASDLLEEGLTSRDISQAIERAMSAARAAGVETRKHFAPMYTQTQSGLIKDCKLSRLGYALTLLNADVKTPLVARWQVQLVSEFFKRLK